MSASYSSQGSGNRDLLLIGGAILFLFGLINGAAIPLFENSRLALSAHLTAVQSSVVMMVFALTWRRISLGKRLKRMTAWLFAGSLYGLWAAFLAAAYYGTGLATPLASGGMQAAQDAEIAVTALFASSAVIAICSTFTLVVGLIRYREEKLKQQQKQDRAMQLHSA